MQQRVFKEKNMFDFALYLKSYKIDTHKKETEKNFGNFHFLKRCWIYGHDSKKSNTDKSPSLFYKENRDELIEEIIWSAYTQKLTASQKREGACVLNSKKDESTEVFPPY